MRLHLNDLTNWSQWKLTEPLAYPGVGRREVEVHFNCERTTVLRVAHGAKGKEKFSLAGVLEPGMTKVFMTLDGEVHFTAETDGEVWFYDPVGRNNRRVNPEPVSFTGPMSRSARDPEMERMWRLMEARMINQVRRREAAMQQQIDDLAAARASGDVVDPQSGEVSGGANGDGAPAGDTGAASSGAAGGAGSGGAPAAGEAQGEGSPAPAPEA